MKASPDPKRLAAEVLAVPGVTDLFPSPHLLARLAGIVAGVTASSIDGANGVEVESTADGSSVSARIGVTAAAPAPDTAREVAEALLAAAPDATVTVQITRIA